MKTENILRIGAIIAFAALIFIGWRSCREIDEVMPDRSGDSLRAVLAVEREALQRRTDSFNAISASNTRLIDSLSVSLATSKVDARKSKLNASYWASKYDSAKDAMDTAMQLAACDSLRTAHEEYVQASEVAIQTADSVISAQASLIQSQGAFIKDQERVIAKNIEVKNYLLGQNDLLFKENAKLKKRARGEKWRIGLAAIAGLIIGKL